MGSMRIRSRAPGRWQPGSCGRLGLVLCGAMVLATCGTDPGREAGDAAPSDAPVTARASSDAAVPATDTPEVAEPRRLGIIWETDLPLGTVSSPRLARSAAGPEILMSFGNEFAVAGGVLAIDVSNGRPRWRVEVVQELFALPTPLTPWPGGEQPWVFAGRNGQLLAVDLDSGQVLWRFEPFGPEGRERGIYNFYSGHEFGDINGDQIQDYLVANGGDSKRGPFEARPPSHLAVISGADGSIIHWMELPDGRESYCSPLIWRRMGEEWVVFGTGGETFAGELWGVPADNVRAGTLDDVRILVPHVSERGAIAPPSFADLDGDGELELIAVPFDGRLVVLSGRTMEPLWSYHDAEGEETQSSPAVGDVDGDGDLDVVTVEQRGVFPQWTGSVLRAFDGASGTLLWDHQIEGNLTPMSPLAVDLDGDGRDEVLVSQCNPGMLRGERSESVLHVVHVDEGRMDVVATAQGATYGTGWVGDADGDGLLEWFAPLMKLGGYGSLLRVNLEGAAPARIAWGGYFGTQHNAVY